MAALAEDWWLAIPLARRDATVWPDVTMRDSRRKSGVTATLLMPDGTQLAAAFAYGEAAHAGIVACAAYCDSAGAKVVTLSTPTSILRDLEGRKDRSRLGQGIEGGRRRVNESGRMRTEAVLLGRIGRKDLLA